MTPAEKIKSVKSAWDKVPDGPRSDTNRKSPQTDDKTVNGTKPEKSRKGAAG